MLYLHYIENSIPNETLGKSFLLTYFSFIVLVQTRVVFPAKASFFSSFLATSRFLKTFLPPPRAPSPSPDPWGSPLTTLLRTP